MSKKETPKKEKKEEKSAEKKATEVQIARDKKIRKEAVAGERIRVEEEKKALGESEKAREVREEEKKRPELLKESQPKKHFKLIMERYKIQNPVKYAKKEKAFLAKLARL